MLKRLELVGFKSFAEKTVIAFAPGITAIVGPNGSGKSNIVDAIKWTLGEQSAKSMRGGEMTDVIFNGSSTRRSLGMAEVSMTFDNTKRIINTESDEVQITRRVYRDGQGEYLINQQLSRLRDIKDMFLGSGAGSGAYSVIEQGRVDALLQSSHKDRRQIFEEAAGISRFKARKIETLRKLETVELNLQRSNDLLSELDKQLRSVKLQAAKAQRYQEYSNDLKELRVGLGLQEYDELTKQLLAETGALGRLRAELDQAASETAGAEVAVRQLDADLAELEDRVRLFDTALADARERIASQEAKRGYEVTSFAELEDELARTRKRRTDSAARAAELETAAGQAQTDFSASSAQVEERRTRVREFEERFQTAEAELIALRAQVDADRTEHLERMRQAARFQNDVVSLKTRLDNLLNRRDGLSARTAQAAETLASVDLELLALTQEDARLQQSLAESREIHGKMIDDREELRRQADEARQRHADMLVKRSGLASRIELLEQLERRQEGLGTGVREVLELVKASAGAEDWSFVVGLVADCLTVPRDMAPLIDLALGDRAQCFLVRDPAQLDAAIRNRTRPFAGRVGFLPLALGDNPPSSSISADGIPADSMVKCELPELAHLPALLLGSTRIVADLAAARTAAAKPENAGLRFVTRDGELLEADGSITVGTHHAETGILSRKSELRELRQDAGELEILIANVDREHTNLRDRAEVMERPIYSLQQKINELIEEASDTAARVRLHQQRRSGLNDEVELSRSEIDGLGRQIDELNANWKEAGRKAEEAELHAQQVQARAEQADRMIREREQERLLRESEATQARVDLAQADERLTGLRERLTRAEADLAERRHDLAQSEQHEAATLIRLRESQLAILAASSALAEAALDKESAERHTAMLSAERDAARTERRRLGEHLQAAGSERQEKWNQAHAHELRANELKLRLTGLCDRLKEDYQIDLAELYDGRHTTEEEAAAIPEPVRLDPDAVQAEIEELRRKLARLGAVNLDALQELAELETRMAEKQTQHDDLSKSRHDLLAIIEKINGDSKTLFTETFTTIRAHFQDLFRKLFGGGMADIVLEDENDILECGIEINARPPGKELRSISLMSGGERTLTAIALLLAIFRSKPSPFCVLDEVDAALDEANNTRLSTVLQEFREQSQFIVVTHKKRTMAIADVLYGITMQESGVSKQVSVRFEDWPEDVPAEAEGARAAG